MLRYFLHSVSEDALFIHQRINQTFSRLKILIFLGLLGAASAIFQSAGGFFPGVGYVISPLATAPIILAMVTALRYGMMSYLVTIGLLIVLQPSELIVFPFTTGLLGIFLGGAFHIFKRRHNIVLTGGFALLFGICLILYGLHLPILGPFVSPTLQIIPFILIAIFSIFYSLIWVEISIKMFNYLKRVI